MEATIEEEGHRTLVPSKWGTSYTSTQTRAFKNPGNLCYRNTVLLQLLHTPLLLNWIEGVHPKKHSCGTTDMSLLCAIHHLLGFYWFGEVDKDTHEICMKRVWKKLLATTWSEVNPKELQDAARFMEALIKQLSNEMMINAEHYWELQRIFRVGLKTRLACKDCKTEMTLEDHKYLLHASFPEIVGHPPSYDVIQAIGHDLEKEVLPWTCEKCIISNTHNNSTELTLSTKHIDYLPEILLVHADYYGLGGQVNGDLKLEKALAIPADMHYLDSIEKKDVRYDLYSIVFSQRSSTGNDQYLCAVKGPTGKWALVDNDFVADEMTLDKLLEMMDTQQRGYILAYQRLPLNGLPRRAARSPAMKGAIPGTKQGNEIDGLGITLNQVIHLREGIEWTVQQRLPLPHGIKHLIELKGKARTHRAKFSLTFTSEETGEIFQGEANISLSRKNKKRDKASIATATKKRGRPAGSGKTAKSEGIQKRASVASRPSTRGVLKSTTPKSSKGSKSKQDREPSRATVSKLPTPDSTEGSNLDQARESSKAAASMIPTPQSIGSPGPDQGRESNSARVPDITPPRSAVVSNFDKDSEPVRPPGKRQRISANEV
ncbi:hypothetical protein BDW59DRAFT_161648 [Aspergillus cavernicola]|uniref:USP domain-containing protein n=1 Tax=Aspergillus cavernicola TaxID=176166 RepID=A0ABR4ICS3_9EURO